MLTIIAVNSPVRAELNVLDLDIPCLVHLHVFKCMPWFISDTIITTKHTVYVPYFYIFGSVPCDFFSSFVLCDLTCYKLFHLGVFSKTCFVTHAYLGYWMGHSAYYVYSTCGIVNWTSFVCFILWVHGISMARESM